MDDGAALLRAILLEPEEDTPRLMYADWLEEQAVVRVPCPKCTPKFKTESGGGLGWLLAGDPGEGGYFHVPCVACGGNDRVNGGILKDDGSNKGTGFLADNSNRDRAEFIRVQIDLARFIDMSLEPARSLRARERELWMKKAYPPARPHFIPSLDGDYFGRLDSHRVLIYERGFGRRVECPTGAFLDRAAAIFAAHPVTGVRLSDSEPWQLDTVNCAWWREGGSQLHNRGTLPRPIYDKLRSGKSAFGGMTYPAAADAIADRSAACVAHARELAGLTAEPVPA